MAEGKIVHIQGDNWQSEVLESPVPVLVDFWAEWCGPCRAIAPILEQLSEEYDGRAKIAKVNVEENQDLAVQFGVKQIPMLLIMKGGQPQEQMTGARNQAELKAKLEQYV